MRKKLLSASLSIIIVVLLLVGCGSSDSSGGTMASGSWTPGQTSIKLLGASWYAENGYIHVFYSIEATNKSSRTLTVPPLTSPASMKKAVVWIFPQGT